MPWWLKIKVEGEEGEDFKLIKNDLSRKIFRDGFSFIKSKKEVDYYENDESAALYVCGRRGGITQKNTCKGSWRIFPLKFGGEIGYILEQHDFNTHTL